MTAPCVCVLAGPNGAGKPTVARPLVRDRLGITTFVNADLIAQGLSGFDPGAAALAAGRLMLEQMRDLVAHRASFAFETTLAARSFAPWLRSVRASGYRVFLVFVWLPTPEFAIARVTERVRAGGHDVPPDTVRRRFARGLANFCAVYRPLADRWWCYDNSSMPTRLVAHGDGDTVAVLDPLTWQLVLPCPPNSTTSPAG